MTDAIRERAIAVIADKGVMSPRDAGWLVEYLKLAGLEVAPAGTMELLGALYGFVESGVLVRNIEHDGEPDFARRQIPFVSTLGKVARLVRPEEEKDHA